MTWPFKKKKIKINDKEFEYDHFRGSTPESQKIPSPKLKTVRFVSH